MSNAEAAVDRIVARAEEDYNHRIGDVYRGTDRMFMWLMLGQWLFGVLVASTLSPYGWEGKQQVIHLHVWVAILGGAAISGLPLALAWLRPGATLTRHVIAVSQMLWSALLIHLSGGRIETHFHVFGSLAFVGFYRDWKVLLTATVVVAADHFLRGMFWPESVYGVANAEWWRFLEHAFWVVFIDAFLVLACLRGVRELREIAERNAQIEGFAEGEWRKQSVLTRATS
jgi:hypothetical protein